MSFGRPPNFSNFKPNPPDRGAFPLDHDGECKEYMTKYMACLQANSSQSTSCRHAGKLYLECRMNSGLMDRDEWSALGMTDTSTPGNKTSKDADLRMRNGHHD